jgi:hypothetical protein
MNLKFSRLSKDAWHVTRSNEPIYRVVRDPRWGNKWRSFTSFNNQKVCDTRTLAEMRDILSREDLL